MAMTYHSEKKNRVYQRKFDHELAREMRAQGMAYAAIARQLGVSSSAVAMACDPAVAERSVRKSREWMREHRREPCLGECGRLVWCMNGDRSGYCNKCLGALRAAGDVREDELRCSKCREWKPDDAFPTHHGVKARRGRNAQCRDCSSATRREYRQRNAAQARDHDRIRLGGLKTPMTNYLVFRQEQGELWRHVSTVEASSPVQAVEKAAENRAEGSYAAVAEGNVVDIEAVTVMKAVARRRPRPESRQVSA